MVDTEKKSNAKTAVLSGLAWKFSERLAAQLISFIVTLVLARLLTPDDYGIVAMVLVFISIADVFVNSGFSSGLIQKKDADDTDFSTMFYCGFACSIALYFAIFFCAPLIADYYGEESLIVILRVFALKIPLGSFNAIQHAYVSRHMLFKRFFWSTLFGTIVSGFVGVGMAYLGFGVWALVAQYFANMIMDTIVLFVTIPWRPKLVFSKDSAKRLLGYGWKVLAADLSGTFFGQLRNLLIGGVYTSADLAFYTRGQQFPTFFANNLTSAVMSVLFPAMANEVDDMATVKRYCRRSLRMLAYVIAPLMFGLAAVAGPVIEVLLSLKWMDCVPYVQLFSIDCLIALLGVVPLQAIKAIGRSDVLLKLEFLKKPVYLLLLILGIQSGVFAVAVTMLVYDVYGTIVNMRQLKKLIGYETLAQLRDVALSVALAAIMGVALMLLPLPSANCFFVLAVKIPLGVAIYVLLSAATNIEEYGYLKSYIKGRRKNIA